MEESVSLNNEIGSVLLKEYNDLIREVHHLGEAQLFHGVDEQMKHSVNENKLLTDDQAILLQCELNSIKVELEKNQLFQHVCREMDQRSIKSDSAIMELENVIRRKETIVETMRKVLAQTVSLFNGRKKIIEGMQRRNDDLKLQLAQADSKIKSLNEQVKSIASNGSYNKVSNGNIVGAIKKSVKQAFYNDIRFELKSFSDCLIYFNMYIGAVTSGAENKAQVYESQKTTAVSSSMSNAPLKCVIIRNENGSFEMKYLFFGEQQQQLNVEKLQSTPFPIPMLIDLVSKHQQNTN